VGGWGKFLVYIFEQHFVVFNHCYNTGYVCIQNGVVGSMVQEVKYFSKIIK